MAAGRFGFIRFTWILAVNCSENILKACSAQPDRELGVGVYRLIPFLRMGIVVIDRLPDSAETLWLKMLGDKESARIAFGEIEQLSSDRREKNDIIKEYVKYCVYLQDMPVDSLTSEEQDFMRTMAEIDVWYDEEINNAEIRGELRGKIEVALKMIRENIPLEIVSRISGFTIDRLQEMQIESGDN